MTKNVNYKECTCDLCGAKEYISQSLIISSLLKADICNYVEKQRKGMADMCHVDVEKVKVISRTEYEERTEDEEDFDWED